MKDQNYKNHARYVPLYHFVAGAAVIGVFIGSIVNVIRSSKENLYSASLILVIAIILLIFWWYARAFALKAQDRAIRVEENFRHFILTGKPFNNRLRMGQIIALRFASDEELPVLTQKATDENLSGSDIKKLIKNWRADRYRI